MNNPLKFLFVCGPADGEWREVFDRPFVKVACGRSEYCYEGHRFAAGDYETRVYVLQGERIEDAFRKLLECYRPTKPCAPAIRGGEKWRT